MRPPAIRASRREHPVVVVGAGPAGLAVALELKRHGVGVVVVEKGRHIAATSRSRARPRVLLSERKFSSLPGLPLPNTWLVWPSLTDFTAYLDSCAHRAGLLPRFGVDIAAVIANPPGGWVVETSAGERIEATDVVIATGRHRVPVFPDWPGLGSFPGLALHAGDCSDVRVYAGQKVLVVGLGNSASEIALQLWQHGASVAVSLRSPSHIVARDLAGVSFQRLAVALAHLPAAVADRILAPLQAATVGDLRPWGIESPAVGPFQYHATTGRMPLIDVGVAALVRQRGLTVMPAIDRIAGPEVSFSDGRRDRFDALIFATGASAGLESLLATLADVLDANGLPKLHGRPDNAHPGLWFCGFRHPLTGALREIGFEARRIATTIASRSG